MKGRDEVPAAGRARTILEAALALLLLVFALSTWQLASPSGLFVGIGGEGVPPPEPSGAPATAEEPSPPPEPPAAPPPEPEPPAAPPPEPPPAPSIADISACGTISTAGQHTLDNDVTSFGTCLTINVSDVDLNCQGFVIGYNTSNSTPGYGILVAGQKNITVRNCIIRDTDLGGAYGIGINLTDANDSSISNTTIQTNGTNDNYGILLQRANANAVFNNTIRALGTGGFNFGIYLTANASGNNVTNNFIRTQGTTDGNGIRARSDVHNNTFLQNNITTNGTAGTIGIYISSRAHGNRVLGNSINTTSSIALGTGIDIDTIVENNTVENNTIRTGGTGTDNLGIFLGTAAKNITVTGNDIVTGGTGTGIGIDVTLLNDSRFERNLIRPGGTGSSNHGIRLANSRRNQFITTNISIAGGISSYAVLFLSSNDTTFNHTTLAGGEWLNSTTAGTRQNFTNTTFSSANGQIGITANFTLAGIQAVRLSSLDIVFNKSFLNATALPFLNTSASIKLTGLAAFTNATMAADLDDDGAYEACPGSVCVGCFFDDGLDTMGCFVTHFTAFAAQQASAASSLCGNISVSTTLNASSSATGNCFTIAADNVTLDCAGYNASGSSTGDGVQAFNRRNVTVRNCRFSSFDTGVRMVNVTDSRVENTTVNSSTYGLRAENQDRNLWLQGLRFGSGIITAIFQYGLNITLNDTILPLHTLVEDIGFGRINFTNTTAYTAPLTLLDVIKFGNNSIFVNTTAAPNLNTSATLMLKGLGNGRFFNPQPIVDLEDDGSLAVCGFCTELFSDSTSGIFIYSTTHFTNYSANETPVGASLPTITGMGCTPNPVNVSNSTFCNATITDSDGVDDVYAVLKYPFFNGSNMTFFPSNVSDTYNVTVPAANLSIIGMYFLEWHANDTQNNNATNGIPIHVSGLFGSQLNNSVCNACNANGSFFLNSNFTNATIFGGNFTGTTAFNSNATNSTVFGGALLFVELNFSFVFNVTLNFSTLFNVTAFNVTFNNTNAFNSNVSNVTALGSFINFSFVFNASFFNATLDNTTILDSILNNTNATNSTIDPSDTHNCIIRSHGHANSRCYHSRIQGGSSENSTVNSSSVNETELNTSTVFGSGVNSSNVTSCILRNSTLLSSYCRLSNVTSSNNVFNSTILSSAVTNTTSTNASVNLSTLIDSSLENSTADNSTIDPSPVRGCRLRNHVLTNSTCVHSQLRGRDSRNSSLTRVETDETVFLNATIEDSNFTNANVTHCTVRGVNLTDSTCLRSTITRSIIIRSFIDPSDLDNCTSTNSTITDSRCYNSTAVNATFTNSTLNRSTANQTILINSTVQNSTLYNATITNATIRNATLDNATINDSTFLDSSAANVTIENSTVDPSDIRGCRIRRHVFSNGRCFRSVLTGRSSTNSNFTLSDTDEAFFRNATIISSNLTSSNATFCRIVDSNLTSSICDRSNITSSSVRNSTIDPSQLDNCDSQDSVIADSTCYNSTKINSTLTNSTANLSFNNRTILTNATEQNSTAFNATITNSTVMNQSFINRSIITRSFLNASAIHNSTLLNVTAVNATVTNCTISNNASVANVILQNCVAQVTGLNASANASSATIELGGNASFRIAIQNNGTGSRAYNLSAGASVNLTAVLNVTNFTLAEGSTGAVLLTANSSINGTHNASMNISTNPSVLLDFTVTASATPPPSPPPSPGGGGGGGGYIDVGGGGGGYEGANITAPVSPTPPPAPGGVPPAPSAPQEPGVPAGGIQPEPSTPAGAEPALPGPRRVLGIPLPEGNAVRLGLSLLGALALFAIFLIILFWKRKRQERQDAWRGKRWPRRTHRH
jgi:uncharacterized protein YjbI with pentapeptide repeats